MEGLHVSSLSCDFGMSVRERGRTLGFGLIEKVTCWLWVWIFGGFGHMRLFGRPPEHCPQEPGEGE